MKDFSHLCMTSCPSGSLITLIITTTELRGPIRSRKICFCDLQRSKCCPMVTMAWCFTIHPHTYGISVCYWIVNSAFIGTFLDAIVDGFESCGDTRWVVGVQWSLRCFLGRNFLSYIPLLLWKVVSLPLWKPPLSQKAVSLPCGSLFLWKL